MKAIPESSVDMVLCDLPYGITSCKWDSVIPFAPLWEQYARVTKENAAIVLFGGQPFTSALVMSNPKMFKCEWIWEKGQATGHFNAKIAPMKAHENILVFYKQKPVYNPQKTTGHKPVNSYTKRAAVVNKTEIYGKVKKDTSGGGETDRFPRTVIKFSSDKQKTKLTGMIHSTQKPVALCEYFIKTYTNEGMTVLDNCMGSGTTGISCLNTNRYFIGIEKEDRYFKMAAKRLSLWKPEKKS